MPKMDVSRTCSQEKSVIAAVLEREEEQLRGVSSGEANPTYFTTESLSLKQGLCSPAQSENFSGLLTSACVLSRLQLSLTLFCNSRPQPARPSSPWILRQEYWNGVLCPSRIFPQQRGQPSREGWAGAEPLATLQLQLKEILKNPGFDTNSNS